MTAWLRSLFSRRDAAEAGAEPAQTGPFEARLALYNDADTVPQVIVLAADDCLSLIDALCKRTLSASQERGGVLPLLALREIIENLLHASFKDVVVSVLADGTVLVSDHGPGIADKPRAMRPGFTTASPSLRRYIRGVGSGLTVAQESLLAIGGSLRLEDNLGGGTVVSLLVPRRREAGVADAPAPPGQPAAALRTPAAPPTDLSGTSPAASPSVPQEGTASPKGEYTKRQPRHRSRAKSAPAREEPEAAATLLTPRQERLLRLFGDLPEVGPSTASTGAGLSLASAYRELVALERLALLEPVAGGKRRLSPRGEEVLKSLQKR